MLPVFIVFFQCIEQYPEVFFISQEIGIRRINKQCFQVMLPDVMRIRFLQPEQVIIGNVQFVRAISFPDIFLELMYGHMQVNENMGMVLIIWDKIFGTFQKELSAEEYEPIRYGLAKPLQEKNLFMIIFHEWINILNDVRRKDISWREKLGYIFGPPGWTHNKS